MEPQRKKSPGARPWGLASLWPCSCQDGCSQGDVASVYWFSRFPGTALGLELTKHDLNSMTFFGTWGIYRADRAAHYARRRPFDRVQLQARRQFWATGDMGILALM